jgi:YhcH/YjgK/YiaL family protein
VEAHPSIDAQEFAYQYHTNKALWDKAFAFLKSADLETIAPGKYVVDGDNVFISVTEGPTKDPEAARWEAHKKYIDIQYVIKGKEKMGVVPIEKAVVTVNFDTTKDIGFYTAPDKDSEYYEASSKAFLIFFPNDVHRPGIKVAGFDATKKLVVKIVAN